jgi:peptidoglycan/LPS O-acetylase OafA/YrhL
VTLTKSPFALFRLAFDMPKPHSEALLSHHSADKLRSPSADTGKAAPKKPKRIAALDFTKGVLVLIMVLYHWLNYFVTGHDVIYKYLRFLPISFTFITGFLISHVYLSKYEKSSTQIPRRLVVRGLKLLVIAAFLNLVPSVAHLNAFQTKAGGRSPVEFAWAFVAGTRPVAFSVLVPIAYLLILSAGLFFISKRYANIFQIASLVLVGCAEACELLGRESGYLQIISIGMLGISVGYIPIDRINKVMQHSLPIFLAYLTYLGVITVWNDSYLLQIVGVFLNLIVIYWAGSQNAESHASGRIAILLGQYSLFAYIAQIAILQILHRGLHPFGAGIGLSFAALFVCAACTILIVEALEFTRRRARAVNKLYNTVFS